MKIESNIVGVGRQVERLMARVPEAAARSLKPDRWLVQARSTAEGILLVLALPQERRFVPQFIATMAAEVWSGGAPSGGALSLKMSTPFPELHDLLASAQAAKGVAGNQDMGMGLFDLPLREFEDLILKWVETSEAAGGKRRDARDDGKSDEDIARLISYIMLSPNIGIKGAIARVKLTPHIEEFLQKSQADRLTPATVDLWLRAVLEGWRALVRQALPGRIKAELAVMRNEL
jgi:hypothetical protein